VCRQPGIAGLCAYRLIADACKAYQFDHKNTFSHDVKSFLKKIEKLSKEALSLLKKGPQAPIKPLINQLMEYCGGYKRHDYTEDEFQTWKSILTPLSDKKKASWFIGHPMVVFLYWWIKDILI